MQLSPQSFRAPTNFKSASAKSWNKHPWRLVRNANRLFSAIQMGAASIALCRNTDNPDSSAAGNTASPQEKGMEIIAVPTAPGGDIQEARAPMGDFICHSCFKFGSAKPSW